MTQLATFANNRTDPTQTTVIRSRFAGAAGGRFRALGRAARDFITDHGGQLRLGTAFADDIFMPWLNIWIAEKILELDVPGIGGRWMRPFTISAYLSGIRYADRALGKAGMPLNMPESFNPVLVYGEEIKVIQDRNFRLLKGITEVMNLQIKENLIRGMLDGLNPRDVAAMISDRVMKIGYTRAVVMARTETIRAHAEATLTRFETFGIDRVNGQAEWITARDSRVCPACEDLDGKAFSLSEARGKLPRHPQCRCSWLPVIPARLSANVGGGNGRISAGVQVIADRGRPYEPLEMSTDLWKQIRPRPVKIDSLVFQQDKLSVEGLLTAAKGGPNYTDDSFPHIIAYQGQLLIDDGHHRIMVALIRGQRVIIVRVLVR